MVEVGHTQVVEVWHRAPRVQPSNCLQLLAIECADKVEQQPAGQVAER